jgi:hypothetical protein
VIVHDFDVPGTAIVKAEAQSPLVIDAYAVLPSTIAAKGFEAIVGRYPKIVEPSRTVKHLQLSFSNDPHVRPAGIPSAGKEGFGRPAAKGLDHTAESISMLVIRLMEDGCRDGRPCGSPNRDGPSPPVQACAVAWQATDRAL